jgi:hypothetical protein
MLGSNVVMKKSRETQQVAVTTTGITLMSLSLILNVFMAYKPVAKKYAWLAALAWTLGMILVVVGVCMLPKSRQQVWRIVVASLGAALLALGVIVPRTGRLRLPILASGTLLVITAMVLDVSRREAITALLGVMSVVVGASLTLLATDERSRSRRWTLITIAMSLVGILFSVSGKFSFLANIRVDSCLF